MSRAERTVAVEQFIPAGTRFEDYVQPHSEWALVWRGPAREAAAVKRALVEEGWRARIAEAPGGRHTPRHGSRQNKRRNGREYGEPFEIEVYRVPLDRTGYAKSGGRYFGVGAPVFGYNHPLFSDDQYIRSGDLAGARTAIAKLHPDCTIVGLRKRHNTHLSQLVRVSNRGRSARRNPSKHEYQFFVVVPEGHEVLHGVTRGIVRGPLGVAVSGASYREDANDTRKDYGGGAKVYTRIALERAGYTRLPTGNFARSRGRH